MAGNITKMEMLIAKKPGVLQATQMQRKERSMGSYRGHRCRGRSEAWGLTGHTDNSPLQIIVKQTSPSADQRHF